MKSTISTIIKKINQIGLYHVFSAYTFNKVISFATNLAIVRLLTKYDYGLFSSAFNIYSIFNIFTGLGMLSAELLFCTEERNVCEKKFIYKYTLICGFLVDIILGGILAGIGVSSFINIVEVRPLLIEISGLLALEYCMQYLLVYMRTKLENKKFSYFSLLFSVSYFVCGSLGALTFGAKGTIAGRYIATIIPIIVAIGLIRNNITDFINREVSSRKLKTEIWIYAIKTGTSAFLNQVIYLIDVAIITSVISEPEVIASYKLATLIPEGLSFIPQAIIVTILPYYITHIDNKKWIRNVTKKLFLGMGFINLIITILLILIAPFLIKIIGGDQYSDSLYYFRVLCISFFFMSTFRLFCTNLLAVFRKTTYNLVIALITALLNCTLDLILINNFQAYGAAWATVFSVIIASMLSFPYLMKVIYGGENDSIVVG